MQIQETITFLRWLCEHEYRIQYSDAAVEVWHYSLRSAEPAVAKQAVLEHYKANEAVVATPGGIAKRAANIKASREAGQRAIDPPAQPVKHPLSWRARNPELWDQLFEEGRRQGNEERRQATERRKGNQEPDHTDWMAA
jgi:hypothetical protein